ncbi:excalibur calcium-binding domain-containing protein [Actinoplanes sp. Pm04-4]|uniref:Excalibur calcium-binding domain-containing protein n=1 Tax=Paractinoplanes pyxinae TaxID=2997416 RepID=A0ABT4BB91_9ACTN|nr:excalibur calcium-binding domain-containing protein [Actinoplanes pyxinae]MCY1143794.1 excalibur calcium-binding domain-containing protein [Actinoplanes pyxinae]
MTNEPRPWQQPVKKNNNTVALVAFGAIALSLLVCGGVFVGQIFTGSPDPKPTTAAPRNLAALPTTEAVEAPAETVPTAEVLATPTATPSRTPTSKPAPTRTTSKPTVKPTTKTKKPKPRPTTKKPKPRKTTKAPTSVYYKNCSAVRAAGAAPIHRGDPGYGRHLDRDGDGIGCE